MSSENVPSVAEVPRRISSPPPAITSSCALPIGKPEASATVPISDASATSSTRSSRCSSAVGFFDGGSEIARVTST